MRLPSDVAICLNAWCFDKTTQFSTDHSAALLAGYQSVRVFTSNEWAALPTLCRGSAMRFLLTRAYDWLNTRRDALVRPHDPSHFLKRLQFHQQVTTPESYGVQSNP